MLELCAECGVACIRDDVCTTVDRAMRVLVCTCSVWVPRGACCLIAPMGIVSSTGLGATGLCVVE